MADIENKDLEIKETEEVEETPKTTKKGAKGLFKDSGASDASLDVEELKNKKKIAAKEKVDFKCEEIYALLYPHGFESTYQGIPVYLIFDGRTVKLSPEVANFVKERISVKAANVAKKKASVENPERAQLNIGNYMA